MEEGHCGPPLAQLVPIAVKLLHVLSEIIETALDLKRIVDRVGLTE